MGGPALGRGREGTGWGGMKKKSVEEKITFDCQMEILKLNLMPRTFIWNMNVNLKSCSVDFRSWLQPLTMVSRYFVIIGFLKLPPSANI